MSGDYVTPAAPLRAIVEELVLGGVRDVVICPGSRSTPLALALHAAPQVRTWVHLDERSGAFFALGLAKGARRPAAILATSGTAVMNFAPAVVEARYGRTPLILLTADRPPELQGIGAPQTIDQVELFGRHAKWFVGLPVPEGSDEAVAEVRGSVGRAIDTARSAPAGPVQIDLPFREPLIPVGTLEPDLVEDGSGAEAGQAEAPSDAVDRVLLAVRSAKRPLIVCGPMDEPGFAAAVSDVAKSAGAVVLPDVLSNVRTAAADHTRAVTHYDAMLRSDRFREARQPDLVLRFGGTPTSKSLNAWLNELVERDVVQLTVDDGGGWNRPPTTELIEAPPVALLLALSETLDPLVDDAKLGWLAAWDRAEDVADVLVDWLDDLGEDFEGMVPVAVAAALPPGATIVVGNSMPVRDFETFMPPSDEALRVIGNRGANGIDGVLSTALGVAAASEGPVCAVVGDLGFLHDVNALVAARRLELDLTVVLIDNDGGGIFSFLPQAATEAADAGLPAAYEELFGTPHGLDLGPVAQSLGARHVAIDHDDIVDEIETAVAGTGVSVLHLRTDRLRNVELHRQVIEAMIAWRDRAYCRIPFTQLDGNEANAVDFDVNLLETGEGETLMLLHGFMGSLDSWEPFIDHWAQDRKIMAFDLLGHGESAAPAEAEWYALERQAAFLARRLGDDTTKDREASSAAVLGYSLGARVALTLVTMRPELVARLVLESPSAGFADVAARRERQAADEVLAVELERDGVEAFVDRWERLSMFASHADMPLERRQSLRRQRLSNDRVGLAASLRGAGQGVMTPLHDRLAAIDIPTLIIAGDRDEVGAQRASEIAAAMPNATLQIIEGVGHTPHLEAPETFDRLVTDFLPASEPR